MSLNGTTQSIQDLTYFALSSRLTYVLSRIIDQILHLHWLFICSLLVSIVDAHSILQRRILPENTDKTVIWMNSLELSDMYLFDIGKYVVHI